MLDNLRSEWVRADIYQCKNYHENPVLIVIRLAETVKTQYGAGYSMGPMKILLPENKEERKVLLQLMLEYHLLFADDVVLFQENGWV